jgi:hypothetical protein
MNRALLGSDTGARLREILGLPQYTTWFSMDFCVDSSVMITCEYYLSLTPDEQGELQTMFKKYRLVEIEDQEESE